MSSSRKKQFALRAVSAAMAALLAPLANAFTPFVIQDIQVNGIQRIDPGAVFGFLPVKVGESFDESKASESIQRLYSSGFFNDVKIDVENNVLVITVQERPTIASISFNGMREFNDKNITQALAQVGFSEGRVFDRSMLERAEFELKQQYLAKGKYGVEVTPIITPLPRNRVGISFDVFEGDLAKIKEINLVGNQQLKTSELLKQMQLTTSGMMTWYTGSNKYSREKLEGDIERLRSYYLDRGFLEIQIEPPQVSISPDRKDIFITLTIHEGDRYRLSDVKLAGDLLGLDAQIQPLVTVKAGETFSAEKTNQTVEAISSYLGGLGYAFANINPNPVLDRENKTADLTFYVDPGRRVYVRRIEIGGNVRTRDQVIRREMRQHEAAWYDAQDIATSRDRIDRLGYFTEVDVSTAAVPGTADQVDVHVEVKEKPTGMINLGVGYGSTDKLMLTGGISQDNIFGSGNSLSLQVNTSKSNRAAILAHTDPYWTKDGISKTTSLYYRRTTPYDNDYSDGDYEVTAIGAGLNFGIPISENDRIYMGASYEHNRLDRLDPRYTPLAYQEFVREFGKSTNAFIFNVGWDKDTRDSAIAPTRGGYTRLSGDFSTLDLRYYMLSAQQQYYLPLGTDYTLALNGLVDWGKSYGGRSFPVIKTVYAGGIGSVRGFEGASLGPRDTLTGDYLGGSRRVVGNVQLYLPFPGATRDRTLRWFIFGDVGRVDNTSGGCAKGRPNDPATDACGWKYAAGIGFSWQSPMGPLELSYGRALNTKPGDEKQAFQFQIGTGF
ncbi:MULTISPECIES: outer membrane protein assembly factor BamA [Paenalcaligenes]|uniref:Outer membrane protein assembly factor BamA n=1 Tax=Paenalcaligenes hermetiae TaxID=1157987 RepID=A0ABP9M7Q7_9BURK|nr:outer membrane protein assembly factor BamA [Paenalcaligenes sp.]